VEEVWFHPRKHGAGFLEERVPGERKGVPMCVWVHSRPNLNLNPEPRRAVGVGRVICHRTTFVRAAE
jgi:hypothetical protein